MVSRVVLLSSPSALPCFPWRTSLAPLSFSSACLVHLVLLVSLARVPSRGSYRPPPRANFAAPRRPCNSPSSGVALLGVRPRSLSMLCFGGLVVSAQARQQAIQAQARTARSMRSAPACGCSWAEPRFCVPANDDGTKCWSECCLGRIGGADGPGAIITGLSTRHRMVMRPYQRSVRLAWACAWWANPDPRH